MKKMILTTILLSFGQWAHAFSTDVAMNYWTAITVTDQHSVLDLVSPRMGNAAAKIENCKIKSKSSCLVIFNISMASRNDWRPLELDLSTQNYEVKPPGALTIEIDSSLTDNAPLFLTMALESGNLVYINNSGQIQLVFTDKKGSVVVNGPVQDQLFLGDITFSNISNPKNAAIESLGQFSANICNIFTCE